VAVLVVGLACGGDSTADGAVVRSDSSGVAIVVTPQPIWSTEEFWTVRSDAELSIGLVEGEAPYLFGSVTGAARLADGTIAVADEQALAIRYFDSNGVFLRDAGRPGDGPGEFNSIYALWQCGGQLYADDRSDRRVSVWSGEGALLREFDLQEPSVEVARGPYRWRCSSTGEIVAAGWGDRSAMPPMNQSQFFAQHAPIWLLDSAGAFVAELGEHVISERVFIHNPQTGGGSSGPHPFGRAASFAADAEHVFVGTAETLEVAAYDRNGTLVSRFRGPPEDLSVSSQLMDRYLNADLPGSTGVLIRRIDELGLPLPPGIPAYSEMRLDPAGYLWVKRFQHPWETRGRWGVFRSDGAFMGHVDMPDALTVFEIGTDYVLGVARDDLDVQRVQIHELRRERQ
jgi:hypothetical protein